MNQTLDMETVRIISRWDRGVTHPQDRAIDLATALIAERQINHELLEACKEAERLCTVPSALCQQLRAAVAKAEGKNS